MVGVGVGGRGKRKLLEEKKRIPLRFTVGENENGVPVAEQTLPHDLDDNAGDGDFLLFCGKRRRNEFLRTAKKAIFFCLGVKRHGNAGRNLRETIRWKGKSSNPLFRFPDMRRYEFRKRFLERSSPLAIESIR